MESFHSRSEDKNILNDRIVLGETDLPDTTPVPTTLVTSISSEFDTINVSKMSKGGITVAHNAITATATSAEIDCRGFNAGEINIEIISGSGTWQIDLLGCPVSGGTFVPLYDAYNALISFTGINSSRSIAIPIISSNFIKIVATEVVDGATVTIRFIPMV